MDHRTAPVEALGYLRVPFAVEDIDETPVRPGRRGATVVGEAARSMNLYPPFDIRGPEEILPGPTRQLERQS